MEYSIGEFSRLTHIGIHTLRYYEHEGLLAPARTAANRRRYAEKDLAWVEFIKRLKETGMPVKEIRLYADLRAAGDATLQARLEMLLKHREVLGEQIRLLQEHWMKLNDKIDFYRRETVRAQQAENASSENPPA